MRSLRRSEPAKKSGQNILTNRCRTTIAERMVETLAELRFIGDQVGLLKPRPGRPQPPMPRALSPALHGDANGVPASYRALAGRVYSAPVVGSTHGQASPPKKAGAEGKYSEFGMENPPGVLCQRCEFVRKS